MENRTFSLSQAWQHKMIRLLAILPVLALTICTDAHAYSVWRDQYDITDESPPPPLWMFFYFFAGLWLIISKNSPFSSLAEEYQGTAVTLWLFVLPGALTLLFYE